MWFYRLPEVRLFWFHNLIISLLLQFESSYTMMLIGFINLYHYMLKRFSYSILFWLKFFMTLPRHFRHSVRHHLHPFFPNFFFQSTCKCLNTFGKGSKKVWLFLNCSPTNWTKRAFYIFFKRSIKIKYKDWIGHIPNFDRNMTKKPSMIFLFWKEKNLESFFEITLQNINVVE